MYATCGSQQLDAGLGASAEQVHRCALHHQRNRWPQFGDDDIDVDDAIEAKHQLGDLARQPFEQDVLARTDRSRDLFGDESVVRRCRPSSSDIAASCRSTPIDRSMRSVCASSRSCVSAPTTVTTRRSLIATRSLLLGCMVASY